MKKAFVLSTAVCLFISSFSLAKNVRGIDIDFVNIGNAGNSGNSSQYGYGSVGYEYRIGKYEITNRQWNAFVSAAGAPTGNPSSNNSGLGAYIRNASWTGTDMPTNCISWLEAAQFCNFLTSGDKSLGAYLFSGTNENPADFLGIDRASSLATYGTTYVIPNENEWYKAAYYKPDGSGYSSYTNGTNIAPVAGVDTNYDQYSPVTGPWDVGTGTIEQNGTFDMLGNVWEWYEYLSGPNIRGGCYRSHDGAIESYFHSFVNINGEDDSVGFRVVEIIPEPTTLLLLALGGLIIRAKK